MPTINLVTFFDNKNIEEFERVLKSITHHYKKNEIFLFIGTTTDASKALEIYFDQFKSFISYNNITFQLEVKIIDNDSNLLKTYNNSFPWWKHISNYSILRLFLHEIFSEKLLNGNPIVYIDTDVLFWNKINEKYLTTDENYAFTHWTSRKNRGYNEFIINYRNDLKQKKMDSIWKGISKKIENKEYFNSGVIIINNHNKWINLTTKIKESLIKLDDQTLLNYFNLNEIKVVEDPSMNYMILIEDEVLNPILVHFASWNKPWLENSKISDNLNSKLRKINYYEKFK